MTSKLVLRNPRLPGLEAIEVEALADSGAVFLCIPQDLCERLELERAGEQRVALADGSTRTVPYVGPIEARFKNRVGFTGAIVIGEQARVSASTMKLLEVAQ